MHWQHIIREEFNRRQRVVDDDVVEELAQHAAASWEAARADGAAPADATANVRQLVQACCDGTTGQARPRRQPLIESASASPSILAGLALDVRHSVRLLLRQPMFAALSVLMIALGIGVTTSIFSVVNGVLLTPLPWPNASRLVKVAETREGGTVNLQPVFSNATYFAWRERATTIDALGGWSTSTLTLDNADSSERVRGALVTPGLFAMLGVSPIIGVGFTPEQATQPVAVLSAGLWRERFGSAPDIVGRSLQLSSGAVTIVGVMPDGFMFPTPDVRLWRPMEVPQAITSDNGRTVWLFEAMAMLKPGATPQQAAEEAQRAARTLTDLGPVIPAVFGSNGAALVTAQPLADSMVGDVRAALWMLLAAVVLLWLAAIGNVASLQMAHAVNRRREVAIRAAIGAGVGRLVRQLLVENAILGLAGGAVGLVLTSAILRALPALLPTDFPRAEMVAIDPRVLGFGALLSVAASAVIALTPARLAARLDVRSAMAGDSATAPLLGGRARVALPRYAIITGQVAIATVLLVVGTLLARSFANQWRLDRGFDAANVLTARVQLPASRKTPAERAAAYDEILSRLRQRPGVRAVGLADSIPLGGGERRFASTTQEAGQPPKTVSALFREVTPSYFDAIGMRLSAGRGFEEFDTFAAERVVVVNRTFARKYLGANPVGAILPAVIENDRQLESKWKVVGILEDALRANATDPAQPELFLSPHQLTRGLDAASYVVIRSASNPMALVPDLREIVRAADSRATVDQLLTMNDRLMRSLARPRLFAVLFGVFALFAATVAVAGLFGGLSYGVTQRTREISLRTALGASRANIQALIVTQGAVMTAIGLVVGLSGAMAGARVLQNYLYGITSTDWSSYLLVAAFLGVTAFIACVLPARRAANIDPLKGLKG